VLDPLNEFSSTNFTKVFEVYFAISKIANDRASCPHSEMHTALASVGNNIRSKNSPKLIVRTLAYQVLIKI
jgi:hypothetical protein